MGDKEQLDVPLLPAFSCLQSLVACSSLRRELADGVVTKLQAGVFEYPRNREDSVELTAKDLQQLEPGGFLNDVIIQFYLKSVNGALSTSPAACLPQQVSSRMHDCFVLTLGRAGRHLALLSRSRAGSCRRSAG